ncbi:hypothetical protein AB7W56_10215 [Providencia rettgeri]
MAKKPQDQQEKTDDLGGLPPELQVDVNTQQIPPKAEDNDDKNPVEPEPEPEPDGVYVVVKGHSVQHNGILYTENQQIELEDSDAERLVDLGVVMSLALVREKLAKANLSGMVTINGG